ncbi:GNAT family N-acetyltransferase [Mammaliicoccus stepanovicii]|uniref:GNAT family acetyltransferase n=1 Tax=Mammaliicoccus stepanovicii TaxID=643214 RepID=A0A239YRI5_9STAP|nr:GNAT family N-acetyltransferase [Mammaliicoccus stepanovicii]PNZ75885.1 GNAT family N-acetyltransferase [Mammaliicoccus stepanovicii]GGI42359.1 N-acetyltransferase [Mammaliicoccus stepanovicii]SNV61699.1 GNAT family acetyltransferase [Mammaliicoccus stepanovicii]
MEIKQGHHKFYVGESEEQFDAEITYQDLGDNVLVVDHTFVDPSLRGKGIARKLVDVVIDKARAESKVIDPVCPYVKEVMNHDQSTHDVLKK